MNRPISRAFVRALTAVLVAGAGLTAAPGAGAATFTQISAGLDHTCAVRPDATVWCWGNGATGQLGVIGVRSSKVPIMVIGSFQTKAVSSGQGYWCERLADASVFCGGLNTRGQLGDGNTTTAEYPQEVAGIGPATRISAGSRTACAVIGGSVACWGDGSLGQLGNGKIADGPQPTPISLGNLNGITDVSVGDTSACAVRNDGLVYCWGDTSNGQLGNGITSVITIPEIPVSGLSGAKNVVVADRHACALKTDGTVWCWGDSSSGQLGDGGTGVRGTAAPVPGLSGVVQISAEALTTCAVKSNGTVFCWGAGLKGQLGNGKKANSPVPVQVSGISDAAQVTVGTSHACVVSRTQVPSCWGSNEFGQLGSVTPTGAGSSSTVPVPVVDSLVPAVLLSPSNAGLRTGSTRGGAVQFRDLSITKTGKFCPNTKVYLTVTAKGKTMSHSTRLSRLNGKCTLNGTYELAIHTLKATTATYTVKARGIKTRQGSVTLPATST